MVSTFNCLTQFDVSRSGHVGQHLPCRSIVLRFYSYRWTKIQQGGPWMTRRRLREQTEIMGLRLGLCPSCTCIVVWLKLRHPRCMLCNDMNGAQIPIILAIMIKQCCCLQEKKNSKYLYAKPTLALPVANYYT